MLPVGLIRTVSVMVSCVLSCELQLVVPSVCAIPAWMRTLSSTISAKPMLVCIHACMKAVSDTMSV